MSMAAAQIIPVMLLIFHLYTCNLAILFAMLYKETDLCFFHHRISRKAIEYLASLHSNLAFLAWAQISGWQTLMSRQIWTSNKRNLADQALQ